jgi:hypothetical protein
MVVVHAQPQGSWPEVKRMHRARAVANEGAMIRNTRAGRKRGNTRSSITKCGQCLWQRQKRKRPPEGGLSKPGFE